MILLGTKQRHLVFWPLVFTCVLVTKFSTFSELRLSLDSIFSGLLALTGFVFTARTFITFKLNEVIYGSEQYRDYVKKLKEDGAYKKCLYDPLKQIDSKMGAATYMCLWATIMFIVVAFLPKSVSLDMGNNVKAEYVCQVIYNADINALVATKKLLLPLIYKVITDATMIYFGFCLYQMVITAKSLHQNISDIIVHWEEEYNKSQAPGKGECSQQQVDQEVK